MKTGKRAQATGKAELVTKGHAFTLRLSTGQYEALRAYFKGKYQIGISTAVRMIISEYMENNGIRY